MNFTFFLLLFRSCVDSPLIMDFEIVARSHINSVALYSLVLENKQISSGEQMSQTTKPESHGSLKEITAVKYHLCSN